MPTLPINVAQGLLVRGNNIVFETLETVPWSKLTHAYGAASDIPELLCQLRSLHKKTRERALWSLYGNIFHQGTRYEATPYAVPFLRELLEYPKTPDRPRLIPLLVSLALGYEDAYLPAGLDCRKFRAERHEALAQMTPDEQAECAEYGSGPQVELDCYDAVRATIPTLQSLLTEDDSSLRQATVYALSWFPEEASTSVPLIYTLLKQSSDSNERAIALIALGLLMRTSDLSRSEWPLASYLDDEAELVRIAAAIALCSSPIEARVLKTLLEPLGDTEALQELGASLLFNEGNLSGYVTLTLAHLSGSSASERALVIPALCQALEAVGPYESLDVTQALLTLLHDGRETPLTELPSAQLSVLDRQALTAIADHGGWEIGGGAIFANYRSLVRAYGLPDSQAALRDYLKH